MRDAAHVRTLRTPGRDSRIAQQHARGLSDSSKFLPLGNVYWYEAGEREGGIAGSGTRAEYVIYDKALGVTKHARTILRMPEPQLWCLKQV